MTKYPFDLTKKEQEEIQNAIALITLHLLKKINRKRRTLTLDGTLTIRDEKLKSVFSISIVEDDGR